MSSKITLKEEPAYPSPANEETYQGDVEDVRTICTLAEGTRFNRVWQPYIARWADNHLIAAWGHHLRGKVDMGDIACSVSLDDGDTWLPPVEIFDHRRNRDGRRYGYANPTLYRAPGQEVVWCFAMRCPLHYWDSENSELCAAYTADGGYSWVEVELTVHTSSPLITCNAPIRFGGRYLLPVHRRTNRVDPTGDEQQFVLESTDLLSWRLAGYVPIDESAPVFVHEAGIAQSGPDELTMVFRTATYGYRNYKALPNPVAYRSTSSDGRTWSVAEPVPELYNTCCKGHYSFDGKGRELYVFSPGPKGQREALHYNEKPAGGDWSASRVFYDGGNKNSYPTLIEMSEAPGRYYCVWDSSDDPARHRTKIRFGKFTAGAH